MTGLIVTVFTVILTIRDGMVNPANRDWFLFKYIPSLPWYWWLIIGIVVLAVLSLEGAYTVHAEEHSKLLAKHRQRVSEIRNEYRERLDSRRLDELIEVKRIELNEKNSESVTVAPAVSPPKVVSSRSTLTNYEEPNLRVRDQRVVEMLARGQDHVFQRYPGGWPAAIAEIKNDPNVDYDISAVDVRAFISFEDLKGQHSHSISDGIWENRPQPFIRFRVAETHLLVVATKVDTDVCAVTFDEEAKGYKTYIPLLGAEYKVEVQLFAKVPGREKSMLKQYFRLSTRPMFAITEFEPE